MAFTKRKDRGVVYRAYSIVAVSLYLIAVGTMLIARKKITPPISFLSLLRSYFRAPYAGNVEGISHESNFCYLAPLPGHVISDKEGASRLVLFESGKPLLRAHASHEDIRKNGRGAYSHWGAAIYFSTSDNSDPRTNGREYTVREVASVTNLEFESIDESKRAAA